MTTSEGAMKSPSGDSFQQMKIHGENAVNVAYNDRSEVTGYYMRKPGSEVLPDDIASSASHAQTYKYDAIGNRRHHSERSDQSVVNVSYQTNALNQYAGFGQQSDSPSHDLDGNLKADCKAVYTWNHENRLVVVETNGIKLGPASWNENGASLLVAQTKEIS